MLIKASDNTYLINLDNISGIFMSGNDLVCTKPSTFSNTGYENFNLISSNYAKGQYHIRRISALYRQYVVSELGTFIPPKVYEIDISASSAVRWQDINVRFINGTGRISTDNRVVYGFEVTKKANGELLTEGKDYILYLPLYKGIHQPYKFVFYLLQSRNYYYYTLTINSELKSVGSDIEMPSN